MEEVAAGMMMVEAEMKRCEGVRSLTVRLGVDSLDGVDDRLLIGLHEAMGSEAFMGELVISMREEGGWRR